MILNTCLVKNNPNELDLSSTFITDRTLSQLAKLHSLQYLTIYLVGAKITAAGLKQLKALTHLQTLIYTIEASLQKILPK